MVEVVAVVKPAEYHELEKQSERERGKQRKQGGGDKILRQRIKRDGKIGAQHVLNAVGEIDEIHHAETEREPRRNQKQQDSELEAVENLDDEESSIHALTLSGNPWRGDRAAPFPASTRGRLFINLSASGRVGVARIERSRLRERFDGLTEICPSKLQRRRAKSGITGVASRSFLDSERRYQTLRRQQPGFRFS